MGIERQGNELLAPITALDIDARTTGLFPMMSVVDGQVWVRHGSKNHLRTSINLDPTEIEKSLQMYEEYVETMNLSDSPDHNTAKRALAEYLFNDENAMVRIDMSEYQERHAVSRLVGAPPGYVGYDEGGQLTEAVRRKPYSVILLDEIEKAHPDVFNILLQVLDDGRLTDNKGRIANFKNTIIIMTTNIGSHLIQERFAEMEEWNKEEILEKTKTEVFDLLKKSVRPEFLNRIDETIMFEPLNKKIIRKIVDIQWREIQKRLSESNIEIEATTEVLDYLGEVGFDPQFGARPLKRTMQRLILNELSKQILAGYIKNDSAVLVDLDADKQVYFKNVEASVEV